MKRVVNLKQLDRITNRLFVEAVCPKCGRVLTSSIPDAKITLIFGCIYCADIDTYMLLSLKEAYNDQMCSTAEKTEEISADQ